MVDAVAIGTSSCIYSADTSLVDEWELPKIGILVEWLIPERAEVKSKKLSTPSRLSCSVPVNQFR